VYEENFISPDQFIEDDQDLMRRFQGGEEEAFQDLFNRYAPRVINFAYRFLHSQAEAEDIAQEVFLRVYKGRERFDRAKPFKPWLFAITSRLISNRLRDAKRHPNITLEPVTKEDETPSMLPIPETALRPDQEMDRQEKVQAVQAALLTLPESQRVVVLLARFEEMSYDEIAQATDMSVASVKSLLFRAKQALKQALIPFLPREKS
jgi:RNA polymerase sigma-70 factor (ECF subfamily)